MVVRVDSNSMNWTLSLNNIYDQGEMKLFIYLEKNVFAISCYSYISLLEQVLLGVFKTRLEKTINNLEAKS